MFKYLSGFKVTFLIVIFYSKMSANNNSQRKGGDSYRTTSTFTCRICRKTHALKYCWRFRNMNTTQRMEAVKKYGYCPNCLAHSHSQGSCFTTTGCGYCQKRHHSLLHTHARLQTSKWSWQSSTQKSPKCTTQKPRTSAQPTVLPNLTSLTAILQQNAATLLPTALVKIKTNEGKHYARCLLDSAARMSSISKKYVDKLGLTTLELDGETICLPPYGPVLTPTTK